LSSLNPVRSRWVEQQRQGRLAPSHTLLEATAHLGRPSAAFPVTTRTSGVAPIAVCPRDKASSQPAVNRLRFIGSPVPGAWILAHVRQVGGGQVCEASRTCPRAATWLGTSAATGAGLPRSIWHAARGRQPPFPLHRRHCRSRMKANDRNSKLVAATPVEAVPTALRLEQPWRLPRAQTRTGLNRPPTRCGWRKR